MKPERIENLVERFGPRLDVVEFTDTGLPHQEEVDLINEIWGSLRVEEQKDIVEKLAHERAVELDTPHEYVPDQTPYAMRLMFYYLKMRRIGESVTS